MVLFILIMSDTTACQDLSHTCLLNILTTFPNQLYTISMKGKPASYSILERNSTHLSRTSHEA
jgi:hypothetical protein